MLTTTASRYQQHQEQRQEEQQHQQQNDDPIVASGSVWLSTEKRRPTLYLPKFCAKYGLNKPCKVLFSDVGNGILIEFLHYK